MWGRHRVRAAGGALALVASLAASGGVAEADRATAEPAATGPREIHSGGGVVYAVDRAAGTVQWLDAVNLAPRGKILELGGPIGRPLVDPAGVVWAMNVGDKAGQLVSAGRSAVGKPIRIAPGSHTLQLTLANGTPVVTDGLASTVTIVGPDGSTDKIAELPLGVSDDRPDSLVVPDWIESAYLPIYSVYEGRLVIVDLTLRRASYLNAGDHADTAKYDPDLPDVGGQPGRPDAVLSLANYVFLVDGKNNRYWQVDATYVRSVVVARQKAMRAGKKPETIAPARLIPYAADTRGGPASAIVRNGSFWLDWHSPAVRPGG